MESIRVVGPRRLGGEAASNRDTDITSATEREGQFRFGRRGFGRKTRWRLFWAILVCVCPVSGAVIKNDPGSFFVVLFQEAVFAACVIAFSLFG